MTRAIDLNGQQFGKWSVLVRDQNDPRGCARWLCRCSCGTERVVAGEALRSGRSTNCGCSNLVDPERVKKRCSACGRTKSIKSFGRSSASKDGHSHYCRPCMNKRWKRYRREKKYGLDQDDYRNLLNAQSRRCAACAASESLVVDHDHVTGEVRGLLCHSCNKALGFLRDDPVRIRSLLSYLLRSPKPEDA